MLNKHHTKNNVSDLENKIASSYKIIHDTLKESAKIISEYAAGLCVIPYATLFTSSFLSHAKSGLKQNETSYIENFNVWPPSLGIATFISISIAEHESIKQYVIEHPYLLMIPIITNILNLGYVRQKKQEEKNEL